MSKPLTATFHAEKTDAEATAFLVFEGDTFPIKDILKARGFRFTRAGFGPTAGAPACWTKEYSAPADKAAELNQAFNDDYTAIAAIQPFTIERI